MCNLPNLQRSDLQEILEIEKKQNKKAKAEAVELLIVESNPILLENSHWAYPKQSVVPISRFKFRNSNNTALPQISAKYGYWTNAKIMKSDGRIQQLCTGESSILFTHLT